MKSLMMLTVAGVLACAAPALAEAPALTPAPDAPSAQQQCRMERGQMGHATFAQTYGTNAKRANAFGKCVSKRDAKTEAAATTAHTGAAQQCKAEQAADPAAFATKYGTNHDKRNAFGKCVSAAAKA